jgi:DNA-binding NtrC family response regulator
MKTRDKILVAESEPIIALDIENQLNEWGFKKPEVTLCPADIPKLVKKKKPGLLILDNDFRTGKEDLKSAIELQKKYNLAIILLIDWMTDELKRIVKGLKSFYCIPKPFDRDELHKLIEEALENRKKMKKQKAA